MAQLISLFERKTFKYIDAFEHLDERVHLGDAKVMAPRRIREGNGYDDGGTSLVTVEIKTGIDPHRAMTSIAQYFSRSGCQHEYDCCGCASTRASVIRTGRRTFSVRIDKSYNY